MLLHSSYSSLPTSSAGSPLRLESGSRAVLLVAGSASAFPFRDLTAMSNPEYDYLFKVRPEEGEVGPDQPRDRLLPSSG